jgi:hypothetical protein
MDPPVLSEKTMYNASKGLDAFQRLWKRANLQQSRNCTNEINQIRIELNNLALASGISQRVRSF